MALVLNEEQQLLKESADGFFAEKAPVSAIRQLRDDKVDGGYDPALWQEMIEMGFSGLLVAEEQGGLGFGYVGAGIVAEAMGKNLSAAPFVASSVVAAELIGAAGSDAQKEALLPAIAAGEKVATLAIDEAGRHDPLKTSLKAVKGDDGYTLSGMKTFVPEGATADSIIVVARTAGDAGDKDGLSLFLIEKGAAGLITDETVMVDSRGWAKLTFEGVKVAPDALIGGEGGAYASLVHVLDRANVIVSAELLGIAQECLDRTVAYLQERKQFGVVIGTFQALQHRAADLYSEIEVTRSIVLKALQQADSDADIGLFASAAKARAAKTAELATNEAIQMHGGVGMTDEFDFGLFIKRARILQTLYGGYSYHTDRFATLNGY